MGWKIFREIARPFEHGAHALGLSGGGYTRTAMRSVGSFYRRALNPSIGGMKDRFNLGVRYGLPIAAAAATYGIATGPSFAASPAALPVVGEQSTAIAAITADAAPAVLTGTELEAAAGSMTVVEGFGAGSAASAGSSTLLSGAASGLASATISKMITKAVDTVINPLFSPTAPRPEGGGGGGGGSAGGYPFQDVAISPVGNNAQFYLIAAALAALLLVAATKAQG